ncbi:MAG: hypothetical protein L6V93_10980 [Clostridiales bacterium]|nr:MAG: hypothetical protein L6V93_10980 [Clostridiales bacterium]
MPENIRKKGSNTSKKGNNGEKGDKKSGGFCNAHFAFDCRRAHCCFSDLCFFGSQNSGNIKSSQRYGDDA